MKWITFTTALFSCLLLLTTTSTFSCNIHPSTNIDLSKDSTIRIAKRLQFSYTEDGEALLDINKDGTPDFKCMATPAGNRMNKLIVGLDADNKIGTTQHILALGDTVNAAIDFADQFNFNSIGDAGDAYFNHRYFPVYFKANGCRHYGWIKFSSDPKAYPGSTTPVYYHNIKLSIHGTGYNQGCGFAAIIQ
ncbi:MAG: hypothetical protein AB8E82_18100 [Aureispira sp.]